MLQSKEECEKSIRYGWIFAIISMLLTLVAGVLSFYVVSDDAVVSYMLDPFVLVDVVLIAVMAYFIRKKSRTAATLMFVYFVLSKWMFWEDTGSTGGVGIAIIFLYIYFMAMLATYTWHKSYATPVEE